MLGHGPIQRFLDDPEVTEVMVNRHDQHLRGKVRPAAKNGPSSVRTKRCAGSLNGSSRVGRRIDESSPLVDARLADGSVSTPLSPPGRQRTGAYDPKFAGEALTVDKLVDFGVSRQRMAELLQACVLPQE